LTGNNAVSVASVNRLRNQHEAVGIAKESSLVYRAAHVLVPETTRSDR
jgi:hypothetical protein